LDLLGQIAEGLSEPDLPYRVCRYTHHVANANSRLVGLDDGRVSFAWKDYRQDGKTKIMTIAADEFIRRFLQHAVPHGSHRTRHICFLATPPSHRQVGTLSRSARRAASGSETAAPLAGSPARPDRPRHQSLSVLRWNNGAPRHAAALSAAAPADVVRQLMIQWLRPPVRSVPRGNTENGGTELMTHAVFSIIAQFVCLKNSLTRPIDQTPTHRSTDPTHRIPHLRKSTSPPRNGCDPRASLYKPHRQARRAV
jgi:hypothetical protein